LQPYRVLPLVLPGLTAQAPAEDNTADHLSRLFGGACLTHLGNPEGTRQWAADHDLTPIQDLAVFQVFVGPVPSPPDGAADPQPAAPAAVKSAAWVVLGPGKEWFALSLRGAVGACAVWARQADPPKVKVAFLRGVKDPENPSIDVRHPFGSVSHTAPPGRRRRRLSEPGWAPCIRAARLSVAAPPPCAVGLARPPVRKSRRSPPPARSASVRPRNYRSRP
jgi:hypothetical protein